MRCTRRRLVLRDELGKDLGGVVGRRVVHHEQLDVVGATCLVDGVHLREQGADAAAEEPCSWWVTSTRLSRGMCRPSRGAEMVEWGRPHTVWPALTGLRIVLPPDPDLAR